MVLNAYKKFLRVDWKPIRKIFNKGHFKRLKHDILMTFEKCAHFFQKTHLVPYDNIDYVLFVTNSYFKINVHGVPRIIMFDYDLLNHL